MALASQTIRQQGSVRAYSADSYAGRRKRRRTRLGVVALGGAALVVLIACAFVFKWFPGSKSAGTKPVELAAQTTPPVAPAALAPAPAQKGKDKQGGAGSVPDSRNDVAANNTRHVSTPPPPPAPVNPPVTMTMGKTASPAPTAPVQNDSPLSDAVRRADNASQLSPSPAASAPASSAPPAASPSPRTEAPPAPAPVVSAPPAAPAATSGDFASVSPVLRAALEEAASIAAQNRPVQARSAYNNLLQSPHANDSDRDLIRRRMSELSQTLTFSPTIVEGDPFSQKYAIKSGDTLMRVTANQDLKIDWRFLQRINRMTDPGRLQLGQPIKIVKGPFHAVVSKSRFRLDLYEGAAPLIGAGGSSASSQGDASVYICSFPVGLGEGGGTPLGAFVVKPQSKLVNPSWKNPRTGEQFGADDPKNPIGERWIGLDGTEEKTRAMTGYGIHGTVDPSSIGREMSMGCVRMYADDVAVVYELLTEGASTVKIVE